MKRFLPVLMLMTCFSVSSWAEPDTPIPAAADDSAQIESAAETDMDSAASPDSSRRELAQRIRSEVLDAVARAIEDNPGISTEDKQAVEQELEELSSLESINFDADIGAQEALLGGLAILLIFGTPIMLVAAFLYAGYRKRRLTRDVISQFLANGQPVPPEVWKGLAEDTSPRNNLHKGMIMVGLGLGVFLAFLLIGSTSIAYLGLIPLFIGGAQLLIWKLEGHKAKPGE